MTDNFLDQYETPADISIEQLRAALLDEANPLNPRFLYRLSDIEGQDLRDISALWPEIALWRRQALLEDLQILAENDYVLSFEAIGRIALQDPDPRVRFGGVQVLITCEIETPDLIPELVDLATHDPDQNVRAVAASALSKFVYLGELGNILQHTKAELEEQLLEIAENDSAAEVRRRALEALGYTARPEVLEMIHEAYQSTDPADMASALFAMGRSADERWADQVLEMLDHTDPRVRLEAVRAAGELGLGKARQKLLPLVTSEDMETRLIAIWALSQIGGNKVFQRLVKALESASDEDEIAFIEQALDNLAFNEDVEGDLGMLYFTELEDNEDDEVSPAAAWDLDDEDLDDFEAADYRALEDRLDNDEFLDADEDHGD